MFEYKDFETVDKIFSELSTNADYARIPPEIQNLINKEIYESLAWKLVEDAKKKVEPKKVRKPRQKKEVVQVEPVIASDEE